VKIPWTDWPFGGRGSIPEIRNGHVDEKTVERERIVTRDVLPPTGNSTVGIDHLWFCIVQLFRRQRVALARSGGRMPLLEVFYGVLSVDGKSFWILMPVDERALEVSVVRDAYFLAKMEHRISLEAPG
jgi:hypothetical protein